MERNGTTQKLSTLGILVLAILLPVVVGAETIQVTYYYGGGWIDVDYSALHRTHIHLSESAFISPNWWHCCDGSAEEFTAVTVTWMNETTGASGRASQTVETGWFFPLYNHTWSATVPLI